MLGGISLLSGIHVKWFPWVSLTIVYLMLDDSPLGNKKVWGFPYLKIEKLPYFHFMFFGRYGIHIQAFVDLTNAIAIMFKSSSS